MNFDDLLICAGCGFNGGMHIDFVLCTVDQDGSLPSVGLMVEKTKDNGLATLSAKPVVSPKMNRFWPGGRNRDMSASIVLSCESCDILTKVSFSFHKGTIELKSDPMDVDKYT